MNQKIIYIRKELNPSEHRTPIIPKDVVKLIENGYKVYVESSFHRIYTDDEYDFYGANITYKEWYDPKFENALIVGIKEIPHIKLLNKHTHIYFSHTYKNQVGSHQILKEFSKSSSILYDFEYFLDENKRRLISFGFYAGVVGCVLGIKQFLMKRQQSKSKSKSITNLSYWENEYNMMEEIQEIKRFSQILKIAIIGSKNGNCSKGVVNILDKLNIQYDFLDKTSDKTKLKEYDIVYNCILLNEDFNEIWFSKETQFEKDLIIVDISCDYSKKNNPIQIYDKETTWKYPVFQYNDKVDIIAINNLPSLLPRNSSDYFSKKSVELLLQFINGDTNHYWEKNKELFLDKLRCL
jgi:saccharopine dehydrogenase (NAD+, L-lysine-forming)